MTVTLLFKLTLLALSLQNIQVDSIAGLYQSTDKRKGGYTRTTLKLNIDSTFQYYQFTDEICYTYEKKSSGMYAIKNGHLKLTVADSLLPKVITRASKKKGIYIDRSNKDLYFEISDSKGNRQPAHYAKGYTKTPFVKVRLHAYRYNIDTLTIDEPTIINVENLSGNIAYHIENYDFIIQRKKLKGYFEFKWNSSNTEERKLILRKIKLKYPLPAKK